LNGRNIPLVNHVKYFGVILDNRITWSLHIEIIEAKAFRTFIRINSLFKDERLSANIKLTLHKALIRSVMTYACPTWELVTDTYLLKLQRLQNMVLQTTGNFARCTPVHNLHMAFNKKKYKIMRMDIGSIGKGEVRHRKYKRLKFGGGQAYDHSND
jgi:hypothetical protein